MDASVKQPDLIPERLCVYTALTGDYEILNEQPSAKNSGIPFICFTDNPDLRSETWEVRTVSCLFENDPVRGQREIKLQPHKYLPEFDVSLYIDNSVILIEQPEAVFQRYFPASGLALTRHSFRDKVADEFIEVYNLGLDDHARILEQFNHYALSLSRGAGRKAALGRYSAARPSECADACVVRPVDAACPALQSARPVVV
jgi:TOD1/MUCI70, glycosyltransferase-like domain